MDSITILGHSVPIDVESLDISYCDLTELPHEITQLRSLKYLNCSGNPLQYLNITNSITELKCSGCKISEIRELPSSLRILDISMNNLHELPDAIASLPHLEYLDCSDNYIEIINNLTCPLIQLNCGSNNITSIYNLPPSLTSLALHQYYSFRHSAILDMYKISIRCELLERLNSIRFRGERMNLLNGRVEIEGIQLLNLFN